MRIGLVSLAFFALSFKVEAEDLGREIGNLSANTFSPWSTSSEWGRGSKWATEGVNNEFSVYGGRFSPWSANNPWATSPPVDERGRYLTANPYLQFTQPSFLDNSLVNNRFGSGLKLYGRYGD